MKIVNSHLIPCLKQTKKMYMGFVCFILYKDPIIACWYSKCERTRFGYKPIFSQFATTNYVSV